MLLFKFQMILTDITTYTKQIAYKHSFQAKILRQGIYRNTRGANKEANLWRAGMEDQLKSRVDTTEQIQGTKQQ